ncbi:metallophosphoesterase family protein [Halorubrum ezzemoulense]|uniref:metallophosphoesterase family protein n=1 Tax=Halorubrum ezzemoulense TaxID=337243 RepID=UPI00232E7AA6|nr:metallophosphoesterase family protein [Halorubrum ezzemoulense]MDB9281067.1 metallophosphoesterase family protein [Halorubrum ezzemoulense]MDB9284871.1 metallophosphoesterase family protein [Halorubrum ezzemoulense]
MVRNEPEGEPSEVLFGPEVEAQHRRLSVEAFEDVYLVGDVHGCRSELESLLDELDPGDDDLVVFVGDLVSKGPDNRGVVERVRELPNAHSVRGNNEEKLLRGETDGLGLTDAGREWIRSCPVAISWPGTLVVHAGVDPHKPLADHDVDDLETVRSLAEGGDYTRPYWWEQYAEPPRVFFGHTVMARPLLREYAVGLDTGCVYGGALTAYDWRRDEVRSVNAERTVESRPESAFVTPRADE